MNETEKIMELSASELTEVNGGLNDAEALALAVAPALPLFTVPLALGIWVSTRC